MVEVAVETRFPSDIDQDEARDVLGNALHREAKWAKAKYDHFSRICQTFERKHRLSSDEFMERFESGDLGDDAEYFDWYAAKRGQDLWKRRLHILSGVQI
jgi:hypothetical protein